ncbi:aminoglycoside phosphotransferase family protein [Virgibacillus necropolis]|uniref:Kinase n=1 Tax=Virgibacillus necropolis TaxID=163877 RepID=A0A221M8B2_9BACI|nr:aminoglycoside phosphotransferase family protein [Virgibacillus necropolis]ASN03872.1 hypothetical protein CFK40_02080 [Virgibacillus necropolis]
MKIPNAFQEKIIGCFGDDGKDWLHTLEAKIQSYLKNWDLTSIGPVSNLSYNYVLRVLDSEVKPCILKLGVPGFDFQNEVRTVHLYNGEGCAKLLKADSENGAILLDQLVPGTMLSEVEDESIVIRHYIKVWEAIRRPLPEGNSMPMISDWVTSITRYRASDQNGDSPISESILDLAERFFHELIETAEPELLHGDLHHENILYSERHGWMAIDPKGVGGDPYFDLISFLFNHLHEKENPRALLKYRIEAFCEHLDLDRERLLKAAISMSTLSVCWSLEDNDPDWDKTYQCTKWLVEFMDD